MMRCVKIIVNKSIEIIIKSIIKYFYCVFLYYVFPVDIGDQR